MRTVKVRLNQQQLELLDRTVSKRGLDTRAELLRLALREYARESQATVAGTNGTRPREER
jgi:metal-responsive CopG/Arc/MetJ family transcriptional regulator